MLTARLILEGDREEVEAAKSAASVIVRLDGVDIGEPGSMMRVERPVLLATMVGSLALPEPRKGGAGPFLRIDIDTRQEDR